MIKVYRAYSHLNSYIVSHIEIFTKRTNIFPIIGWRFCHLSTLFLLGRRYCNSLGKADKNNCANSTHHLPHQRMQKMIAPTNATSAINWVPPQKNTCLNLDVHIWVSIFKLATSHGSAKLWPNLCYNDSFKNLSWLTNVAGVRVLKNCLIWR